MQRLACLLSCPTGAFPFAEWWRVPLRSNVVIDVVRLALPVLGLILAAVASSDAVTWFVFTGLPSGYSISGTLCTFRFCASGACQLERIQADACTSSDASGCSNAISAYQQACSTGTKSGATAALMYGICVAGLAAAYFSRSERQYLVALRIASGAAAAAM